ncbi:MAG: hydrogen gas-evolving membrane-bound hydrogenase subunit E, partial [Pseudomonadota bacterium]
EQVSVSLHLWEGFNIAVFLSIITIVLGILLYRNADATRKTISSTLDAVGWGPDKGFDQFVAGLVLLSSSLSRKIQFGRLEGYLTVIFVLVAIVLWVPLTVFGEWPSIAQLPAISTIRFYELAMVFLAVIGIVAVIWAKNRLTAVVSLGIQGFAVALIFMLFGAPDLAFTQFMVETLSVVILALVLTRMALFKRDHRGLRQTVIDGTIAVVCGIGFTALLLRVVSVPFDPRLSEFFAANSYPVALGRNIVNVILVDYRGIDTLGEIGVVVVAGLAVLALIRLRPKGQRAAMTDPAAIEHVEAEGQVAPTVPANTQPQKFPEAAE